jgi:DNA-binding NarL/FixJ family response regulator
MFSSRVLGAATSLGLALKIVPNVAALPPGAGGDAQLVFVDLTMPGIELATIVEALRVQCPAAKIIAFGPHVDEALLAEASHVGCDAVLTRSQFQQRYVELLKSCLA